MWKKFQEDLEEITEDDTEEDKEHTRSLEVLTEEIRHLLKELEALKKKE